MPKVSVVISMFNNAKALLLTLTGYEVQTEKDFEIIIADDGSNTENKNILFGFANTSKLNIVHAEIPDNGFQKCKALNNAVRHAEADYLIFTDADIIPRQDFVEKHISLRKPGYFISGGSHINTPEDYSRYLSEEVIKTNECFTKYYWRNSNALTKKMKQRFEVHGAKETIMNLITWRTKAFNGSNASCWKKDFCKVNGFDEDFGYGGLDVDFGLRLSNAGIKSRRYTYSLIGLHQWHERPYKDPLKVKINKQHMRSEHRKGRCIVQNGYNRQSKNNAEEKLKA